MTSLVYGQEQSFIKLPNAKQYCPTYIVKPKIISSEKAISKYKKEEIIGLAVLYDNEHPDYRNLKSQGVLFVELSVKVKTKSQSQLNSSFYLPKKNGVYVDGFLVENRKFKIATESIVEIEIVEPTTENGLARKAINVWTLTKEECLNGCKL